MDVAAIRLEKRRLRRAIRAAILALDPEKRRDEDRLILERFADLPGLDSARVLLLYASYFAEEVPTWPLLAAAIGRGAAVACPIIEGTTRQLRLARIAGEADFHPGPGGIPEPRPTCPIVEPEAVDWALVPGLGYDDRADRLGRGAGHYDRLLPRLRPEVPRWSLALSPQWVASIPTESHDQPLTGVLGADRLVIAVQSATNRMAGGSA